MEKVDRRLLVVADVETEIELRERESWNRNRFEVRSVLAEEQRRHEDVVFAVVWMSLVA